MREIFIKFLILILAVILLFIILIRVLPQNELITAAINISILSGIVSSIIGSVMFYLALSTLKPKIQISEEIAKHLDDEGNTVYQIKIINLSPREVTNIKGKLCLVTELFNEEQEEGYRQVTKEIRLKTSELFYISALRQDDKKGLYAYKFTTSENIEQLWSNPKTTFLRFTVFATDSFSNFGAIFEKKYRTKKVIKDGYFESRKSLKIVIS